MWPNPELEAIVARVVNTTTDSRKPVEKEREAKVRAEEKLEKEKEKGSR